MQLEYRLNPPEERVNDTPFSPSGIGQPTIYNPIDVPKYEMLRYMLEPNPRNTYQGKKNKTHREAFREAFTSYLTDN